ncbi:TPA: hypothetical protein ACQUHH_005844, partial [Bacillus mobilis]
GPGGPPEGPVAPVVPEGPVTPVGPVGPASGMGSAQGKCLKHFLSKSLNFYTCLVKNDYTYLMYELLVLSV